MKKVIFGNITFHHFSDEELKLFATDNEQKALVHSVDKIFDYETEAELNKIIDTNEGNFESWLAPDVFKGEIVYEDIKDVKLI